MLAHSSMVGCEVNGWLFDPSQVGGFQRTPVVLPILNKLDVIDEPLSTPEVTTVRPEDLVAEVSEYTIGPGDLLPVTVFELIQQGVESVQTRRVDEMGMIRLPIIGPVETKGRTPSQLEHQIADLLVARDLMRNPAVSVIVQEARQRTFSVIGEPRNSGVAIGTYPIPASNFHLLDAIAMVRGIPGQIKKLQILRPVSLQKNVVYPTSNQSPSQTPGSGDATGGGEPLLKQLFKGLDEDENDEDTSTPTTPGQPDLKTSPPPSDSLSTGLEAEDKHAPFIYVDGKWVRAKTPPPGSASTGTDAGTNGENQLPTVTQRIIEIPYERLREGDMRYNIVIRPGDIISVPSPSIGFAYIGGQIARPGTFTVPGDRDLTLRQLIFAAGGLNGLAIPERVELTRRIGLDHAAIVRLNARAIFNGTQPDIFIKPNDTINVGTNFFGLPLAVIRNGFRMTYGFGFVLDRNFNNQVFGSFQ